MLLDGRDIREYGLADLRRQFAVVQQEPVLFSTSIAENIGYAVGQLTPAAIEEAARAAHAHEFIERLPDGYDTVVGERGMTLSGGQRQRIAIARAFLKGAPVLVLDEPTSAVDSATEGKIVEAMSTLMAGRTTFVVSHRPALLELCDGVLVVHDGRVSLESRPQPPTAQTWRGSMTSPLRTSSDFATRTTPVARDTRASIAISTRRSFGSVRSVTSIGHTDSTSGHNGCSIGRATRSYSPRRSSPPPHISCVIDASRIT